MTVADDLTLDDLDEAIWHAHMAGHADVVDLLLDHRLEMVGDG